MLFGLEKDWAKQFKDLYTQPPDWYHGNVAAFNIGYLSGSLGDFSQSSGQVFSAPSSSSGSGFSGGAGGGGRDRVNGTVAPPSSRSTAALTCGSRTRISAAICRMIFLVFVHHNE